MRSTLSFVVLLVVFILPCAEFPEYIRLTDDVSNDFVVTPSLRGVFDAVQCEENHIIGGQIGGRSPAGRPPSCQAATGAALTPKLSRIFFFIQRK